MDRRMIPLETWAARPELFSASDAFLDLVKEDAMLQI